MTLQAILSRIAALEEEVSKLSQYHVVRQLEIEEYNKTLVADLDEEGVRKLV